MSSEDDDEENPEKDENEILVDYDLELPSETTTTPSLTSDSITTSNSSSSSTEDQQNTSMASLDEAISEATTETNNLDDLPNYAPSSDYAGPITTSTTTETSEADKQNVNELPNYAPVAPLSDYAVPPVSGYMPFLDGDYVEDSEETNVNTVPPEVPTGYLPPPPLTTTEAAATVPLLPPTEDISDVMAPMTASTTASTTSTTKNSQGASWQYGAPPVGNYGAPDGEYVEPPSYLYETPDAFYEYEESLPGYGQEAIPEAAPLSGNYLASASTLQANGKYLPIFREQYQKKGYSEA